MCSLKIISSGNLVLTFKVLIGSLSVGPLRNLCNFIPKVVLITSIVIACGVIQRKHGSY